MGITIVAACTKGWEADAESGRAVDLALVVLLVAHPAAAAIPHLETRPRRRIEESDKRTRDDRIAMRCDASLGPLGATIRDRN